MILDDFLQMHIFFAITSLAVIVVGALLAIGLWRVNRILKEVEHIARVAAIETDLVRQDIEGLRKDLKAGKNRLASFSGFLKRLAARHSK